MRYIPIIGLIVACYRHGAACNEHRRTCGLYKSGKAPYEDTWEKYEITTERHEEFLKLLGYNMLLLASAYLAAMVVLQ